MKTMPIYLLIVFSMFASCRADPRVQGFLWDSQRHFELPPRNNDYLNRTGSGPKLSKISGNANVVVMQSERNFADNGFIRLLETPQASDQQARQAQVRIRVSSAQSSIVGNGMILFIGKVGGERKPIVLIATNSHLVPVNDANSVAITVSQENDGNSMPTPARLLFNNPGEDTAILAIEGTLPQWMQKARAINLWNGFKKGTFGDTYGSPDFELSETLSIGRQITRYSAVDEGFSIRIQGYLRDRFYEADKVLSLKQKHLEITTEALTPPLLAWGYVVSVPVMPGLSGSPVFWLRKNHFLGMLSQRDNATQNAIIIPADVVRSSFCHVFIAGLAGSQQLYFDIDRINTNLNAEGCHDLNPQLVPEQLDTPLIMRSQQQNPILGEITWAHNDLGNPTLRMSLDARLFGQQFVFDQGDKIESSFVGDNRSSDIGDNRSSDIGDNRSSDIGDNRSSDIGDNRSSDIGDNRSSDIGDNRSSDIGNFSFGSYFEGIKIIAPQIGDGARHVNRIGDRRFDNLRYFAWMIRNNNFEETKNQLAVLAAGEGRYEKLPIGLLARRLGKAMIDSDARAYRMRPVTKSEFLENRYFFDDYKVSEPFLFVAKQLDATPSTLLLKLVIMKHFQETWEIIYDKSARLLVRGNPLLELKLTVHGRRHLVFSSQQRMISFDLSEWVTVVDRSYDAKTKTVEIRRFHWKAR